METLKALLREVLVADDANADAATCLPYELTERIRSALGRADEPKTLECYTSAVPCKPVGALHSYAPDNPTVCTICGAKLEPVSAGED